MNRTSLPPQTTKIMSSKSFSQKNKNNQNPNSEWKTILCNLASSGRLQKGVPSESGVIFST